MATLAQLVQTTRKALSSLSENPVGEVACLIEYCCDITSAQAYAYPERLVTKSQQGCLDSCLERRLQGEPLAYIIGRQDFWTLSLEVSPDTLIPRPETECMLEWLLQQYGPDSSGRIADLGTGSGALALAFATERPHWDVDATDQSQAALEVAQRNASYHALECVKFLHGNWCDALSHRDYTVLLSNPPYVELDNPCLQSLAWEPQSALAAGPDGLEALRILIDQARYYLLPDGLLVLEHGSTQQDTVVALLQQAGYVAVVAEKDCAGLPRWVAGRWEGCIKATE